MGFDTRADIVPISFSVPREISIKFVDDLWPKPEKDLLILVGNDWIRQQRALEAVEAYPILGCLSRPFWCQKVKGNDRSPLFTTCKNLLVQETSISWSKSSRASLGWLGAGAHGVWGETEDLFGLGKTRQRMDLIIIFHYLMGVYREDEVRLFSGAHSERQEATVAHFGRSTHAVWIYKKAFHNNSG